MLDPKYLGGALLFAVWACPSPAQAPTDENARAAALQKAYLSVASRYEATAEFLDPKDGFCRRGMQDAAQLFRSIATEMVKPDSPLNDPSAREDLAKALAVATYPGMTMTVVPASANAGSSVAFAVLLSGVGEKAGIEIRLSQKPKQGIVDQASAFVFGTQVATDTTKAVPGYMTAPEPDGDGAWRWTELDKNHDVPSCLGVLSPPQKPGGRKGAGPAYTLTF